MGRIIPAPIASLVKDEHEKNGNKIYLNCSIKNINKVKTNNQSNKLPSWLPHVPEIL